MSFKIKRYHLYNIFKFFFKVKEKRIIFNSYYAKQYSDNPKWFYEYLIDINYNGEYIWVLNDKKSYSNIKHHTKLKIIHSKSIKWLYYMATSRLWVINCNLDANYIPQQRTIFLQTWHGTPLKKIGLDIIVDSSILMQQYLDNIRLEVKNWTYILSPNIEVNEKLKSAFNVLDEQILEVNYPRNDIFKNADSKKLEIMEKLNIQTNKKIILYTPTFRTNDEVFNLQLDKALLKKSLKNDYIFLFRKHSNIKRTVDGLEDLSFFYDVSSFDDIQELYLVADILITDYSSVFFDYALLERLMIFYPYDLEIYQNKLRGFYYEYSDIVPGPIVKTTIEIIDTIKSAEKQKQNFIANIKAFNKKFNKQTNNTGSEELFNLLELDYK